MYFLLARNKKEGKKYIFMIFPKPCKKYNLFMGIKNIGGKNTETKLGIIIGILIPIIFILILILIIFYKKKNKSNEQIIQQFQMYQQPHNYEPPIYQNQPLIPQQQTIDQNKTGLSPQ